MKYATIKLLKRLPGPVKRLLARFVDKHKAEMLFQRGWAKEFSAHQEKVLTYWETVSTPR